VRPDLPRAGEARAGGSESRMIELIAGALILIVGFFVG
jgi:hypothetical protein